MGLSVVQRISTDLRGGEVPKLVQQSLPSDGIRTLLPLPSVTSSPSLLSSLPLCLSLRDSFRRSSLSLLPMATELIPMVDLRLLSEAEINTLSLSCPNAFDPRRCDDIVVPKIDRSVFNESAGSRKQTYSRLRLAPRKPDAPPSSSSSSSIARHRPRGLLSSSPHSASATAATDGADAEDDDPGRRENEQIVSFLRQLFARRDSSAPPPQVSSQSQTLAQTVATPISAHRNPDAVDRSSKALLVVDDRDREVLNAKGVAVDLVGLGEKVAPFGEELRRRTAGLKAEKELLRFLTALEGKWGSRRKRRKIIDASVVGDDLPRG